MKFFDKWDRQLIRLGEDRFYFVLIAVMALTTAVLSMGLAFSLHGNFWSVACDTAAIQNAIVNTLHGHPFRDTAYDGPNLLGLHTMPVLLLVAPIYAMFPSPETLFVLQIIGIYSTLIPLYFVGVEVLKRPLVAFVVAALALSSPILLPMAVAPFHPETWITAGILWSYYFYRKNRAVGFWISLAFAVSCSEQAALIYIALGLSWLLFDDGVAWRKRYGIFALAGGLGWMVVAVMVITPMMHSASQKSLFAYNYADWGIHSASGLLSVVMREPLRALLMLMRPDRWVYVVTMVGFPLFLAMTSWRSLILLAPFPVYFFMTNQEFYVFFHAYYYQFAFIAGYLGLLFLLSRWDVVNRLGILVLAISALVNVVVLCNVASFYIGFNLSGDMPLNDVLRVKFAEIPPDAAVYGPHRYSAYLSNRENMVMGDLRDEKFDFKAMLDAKFDTTDVHPEQIDYIVSDLMDDQCGPRQAGFNQASAERRTANVNQLIKSGEWKVFWSQDNVIILKRVEK